MSHLKYTRYFGPYVYFSYGFRIILDDIVDEYIVLAPPWIMGVGLYYPNFDSLKTDCAGVGVSGL